MAHIHENDVVIAFRQAVEEELHHLQDEDAVAEPILISGATADENLARLARSHAHLQSEVALLRTIILKLISEPVDETAS
ncbi:hypothetical protein B1R32_13013 [Abditibacterium utsteinense]|uniref:Uncharacterized protein n=1 Tax=Abditibacterium utsteinense TaxID=1960156 RepID=A0A2S8SP18_9BACT|nr:hypothetical protein [Abditibacterium utsteinense]PQV62526.1 hypothetical protein B1R32_13013 [Abditibacterium utsteinense]